MTQIESAVTLYFGSTNYLLYLVLGYFKTLLWNINDVYIHLKTQKRHVCSNIFLDCPRERLNNEANNFQKDIPSTLVQVSLLFTYQSEAQLPRWTQTLLSVSSAEHCTFLFILKQCSRFKCLAKTASSEATLPCCSVDAYGGVAAYAMTHYGRCAAEVHQLEFGIAYYFGLII